MLLSVFTHLENLASNQRMAGPTGGQTHLIFQQVLTFAAVS